MKKLFELHPDKQEVFKTSDGYMFWEKAKAESHASGLKDKAVERLTKYTLESPVIGIDETNIEEV